MRTLQQLMSDNNLAGVYLDDIDFNAETEEQIKKFSSFILTNPKIKSVSFWPNDQRKKISELNWNKAKPILEAVAKNKNIQRLHFAKCFIEELTEEQANNWLAFIKKSNISAVLIGNDTIQKTCPALDLICAIPVTSVKYLDCVSLCLGEEEPGVLKKLKTLIIGNLISLSLRSNFIGNDEVEKKVNNSCSDLLLALFDGKLEIIDLSVNLLGLSAATNVDDWVRVFNKINAKKTLLKLDLSDCGLEILSEYDERSDEFLALLEDFLKNTHLTEINLSDNDFGYETTERLLKAALQNDHLVFKLTKTSLSESEVAVLRENIKKELSDQKKPREQEHKETQDIPLLAKPLILSSGVNSSNSTNGIRKTQSPDSRNNGKLKK